MKHCWEIDSRIRYNGEEMRKLCKVIATTKGRAGSWAVNFWHKKFPGSEVKVKKITEIEMDNSVPLERNT